MEALLLAQKSKRIKKQVSKEHMDINKGRYCDNIVPLILIIVIYPENAVITV